MAAPTISSPQGDGALQLENFFWSPEEADRKPQPGASVDWTMEPEFPSPESVLANVPPPLLWTANEDIRTKPEYLEKQYRMQRYEAIEPTRHAVAEFRTRPSMMEGDFAYIYNNAGNLAVIFHINVHFQGFVLTAHGAASRVSFHTDRAPDAPVDWANSGRLRQGSLVVLSPVDDAFRSKCLIATVAYRFLAGGLWPDLFADPPEPIDTQPRVDLYFPDWSPDFLDPDIKYYMLEAKNGYFESFRHTMLRLQQACCETSILDKYLLPAPAYQDGVTRTDSVDLRRHTTTMLDQSQAQACKDIIEKELAVIQGPPGTGKTHTTVITIEEILRQFNPTKPIIVAAQTNHALDQLLERCAQKELNICRIGGRTVSDIIGKFSLYNVRQNMKGAAPGIGPAFWKDYELALQVFELALKKATRPLGNPDLKSFLEAGIITREQYESLHEGDWEVSEDRDPLLTWLGWESFPIQKTPRPFSVAAVATDAAAKWKTGSEKSQQDLRQEPDPDKPNGPYIRLTAETKYAPSTRLKCLLLRNKNLEKIKPQHREDLFAYMCHQLTEQAKMKLAEAFQKHKDACDRLRLCKVQRDERVIERGQIQILGCTITGLCKYRELLLSIGPDVLIIDEASEATEGSIAAAFLPSLKHLALVGDHQQLTPRPITRILTHKVFALNVSLFERLVLGGMPYQMLTIQRRMIPKIRQLVNIFYPELGDHSSVMGRERTKGVAADLLWFTHTWPEQASHGASGHSFCNNTEADMIVGFAKYLISCGTPVEKLTILTFYTGQQELIQSKLGVFNVCKTVDSFQGCENDVILLSMVRSPGPGQGNKVGFLENVHRATVALSRARNNLFVFGNAENLRSSETWRDVLDFFEGYTSERLTLTCPLHGTESVVLAPEDWTQLAGDAGCHGAACGVSKPINNGAMPDERPDKTEKMPTGKPTGKEVKSNEAVETPVVNIATIPNKLAKLSAKSPVPVADIATKPKKLAKYPSKSPAKTPTRKYKRMPSVKPGAKKPIAAQMEPGVITKLDKSALDRLGTGSSAKRWIDGDAQSAGAVSQNSTAHSSEDIMELGYDAYLVLAEFDDLVTEGRERMMGEKTMNEERWGDLISLD